MKKTKMRLLCPVCKKKCAGRIPRGGDGSSYRPMRHISALDGFTDPCPGVYMDVDASLTFWEGGLLMGGKPIVISQGMVNKVDRRIILYSHTTKDNEYPDEGVTVLWDADGETHVGGYDKHSDGWFDQGDIDMAPEYQPNEVVWCLMPVLK